VASDTLRALAPRRRTNSSQATLTAKVGCCSGQVFELEAGWSNPIPLRIAEKLKTALRRNWFSLHSYVKEGQRFAVVRYVCFQVLNKAIDSQSMSPCLGNRFLRSFPVPVRIFYRRVRFNDSTGHYSLNAEHAVRTDVGSPGQRQLGHLRPPSWYCNYRNLCFPLKRRRTFIGIRTFAGDLIGVQSDSDNH